MNSTVADTLQTDLGFPYLVISLLILMTNFVVIFVIIKSEEIHMPTLWVICNMAVWDFLSGLRLLLVSVPFAFFGKWPYSRITTAFSSCIYLYIPAQNMLNVASVVVDRFIAVRFPFAYPRIATKRNYGIALFCTISLNTIRLLMILFPNGTFFCDTVYASCYIVFKSLHGTLASVTVILGSFSAIIVCSCILLWDIKRTNQVVPQAANGKGVSKLTLMSLLNAGVFCLSYLPLCVCVIVSHIAGKDAIPIEVYKFAQLALISSNIFNVVIYAATFQQFRQMLTKLFCKPYYLRKRRENEQVQITEEGAIDRNC